jgi:capsular polysaccharide biosynthesis protein
MGLTAGSALRVVARAWKLLLAVVAIGALAGWGISAVLPTRYRATAYLLGTTAGPDPIASALLVGESTAYTRVATDPSITGPFIRQAGIPIDPARVSQYVSAAADPNSPLLAITATTAHPQESAKLANTVADRVAQYSVTFADDTGYELSSFAKAVPPPGAAGPGPAALVGGGAVVLLMITVAALVVRADSAAEEQAVVRRPRARTLRHAWKPLVIAIVLGIAAGLTTTAVREPTYRATAYLVGVRSGTPPIDSSLLIGESKAFARVVDDPSVVGAAVDQAGVHIASNRLRARLTPQTDANDPVLKITASARNATGAALLANTVADSVAAYSRTLTQKTGYQLNEFEQAVPPASPSGPGRVLLTALWGAAGALVGLALVFVVSDARGAERTDDGGTIAPRLSLPDGADVLRDDDEAPGPDTAFGSPSVPRPAMAVSLVPEQRLSIGHEEHRPELP